MSRKKVDLRWRGCTILPMIPSNAENHDLSRLDERCRLLSDAQPHLAHRICCDHGRNALSADGEGNLRHKAIDGKSYNPSNQLIARTDAPEISPSLRQRSAAARNMKMLIQFTLRNPMVATGGGDRLNLLHED